MGMPTVGGSGAGGATDGGGVGRTPSSSSITQAPTPVQDPFSLCGCSQDGYSGGVYTGEAGCSSRTGERFT